LDFSLAFYLRVTVLGTNGFSLQRNRVFTASLAKESAVIGLEKCLLDLIIVCRLPFPGMISGKKWDMDSWLCICLWLKKLCDVSFWFRLRVQRALVAMDYARWAEPFITYLFFFTIHKFPSSQILQWTCIQNLHTSCSKYQ